MDTFLMLLLIALPIVWFVYEDKKQHKQYPIICKEKGNKGEAIVAEKLSLLSCDYIVKNNIIMNGITQIDHLVICAESRDIFVIETKYWAGIISGETSDKKWMQDNNGMIKYYGNPILQNKYHCKIVRRNYRDYNIHNIVVFVNNKNVPESRIIKTQNELVNYIYKTTSKVYNRATIDMQTD